MTVAEAVDVLPRRMSAWAARLSIAPNSMTGISLALGLCAAVWFTAGTRPGNMIGALALCGSYLAGRSARGLGIPGPGSAAATAVSIAGPESPGIEAAGIEAAGIEAAVVEASGAKAVVEASGAKAVVKASGAKAVVKASGAKAVVKASMAKAVAKASGAKVAGSRAAAISDGRLARAGAVVTGCEVYACLAAGGLAAGQTRMWQLATTVVIVVAVSQLAGACGNLPPAGEQRDTPLGLTWRILAFPYGGQVLLIAVTAPVWGARAALFGLLGWAVIAIGYAVIAGRPQRAGNSGIRPVLACRDDGPIAIGLGLPIRGQLVPLPPVLTGLAAVCVLAVLGLRDIPGFLLLAPVIAMLLAAVGSSHPHDGRLDWLVPVVLQAGQYVYIAAIGFAEGVPAPVIFALCALIAVHYADLARHAQRHMALGWDGRIIAAGLGAALGIATFAYLLLAAYVGVLICREVRTSWLAAMEGDRR